MIEQSESQTARALDNSRLLEFTEFAGELADRASGEIMPRFRMPMPIEDKGLPKKFDPVTAADKAAEAVMRSLIRERYPHHGILGEEHGHEAGDNGLTWVLDPIDGTRAFITGLPLWGTLIALFDGHRVLLGMMDQPVLKERYIGNLSQSVCLQDGQQTELVTRQCHQIADAIMMTTSYEMFSSVAEQTAYKKLMSSVRMSRFGGDCYAYCMLARGFVDLVVEADLKPYDIQALIPIVEGAGGVVTNWYGEPACAGGQVIAAGTAELHKQALEMLNPAANRV